MKLIGTLDQNEIKGIVNDLSDDTQDLMAYQNSGLANIKPNMISGYGVGVRPYYSDVEPDPDSGEYAEGDFVPLSAFTKNTGVDKWIYDNAGSLADFDMVSRAFNMMQNINDYNRSQNLDAMANQMRQENLYGDVLADMLQQTPKGTSLMEKIKQRPEARQRNIQGSGTGGYVPAGSPNYSGGVGFW